MVAKPVQVFREAGSGLAVHSLGRNVTITSIVSDPDKASAIDLKTKRIAETATRLGYPHQIVECSGGSSRCASKSYNVVPV